jgi:hypothetical protein
MPLNLGMYLQHNPQPGRSLATYIAVPEVAVPEVAVFAMTLYDVLGPARSN